MSEKRIFTVMLMGMLALAVGGCTSVAKFDYNATPGTMIRLQENGAGTKSIAVMPAMDLRSTQYRDEMGRVYIPGDSGSFYFGFLPFWPFSGVEMTEPERSKDFTTLGRFHLDLGNDFADAAQQSLRTSNLFSSVVRANNLEQAQTDYIWRSKVYSTRYSGHMYQYGITYFLAPVLWVFGAPMGDSVNELWIDFELIERSSGSVVWRYAYRNKDYLNHWIYARVGDDVSMYPQLLKQAMNSALLDLNNKLPQL